VYEQAIYLYIARHTIVEGKVEATIGLKSARRKLAFGIGKAGTPPSERIIYDKLRSLESKECVKVLSSERSGIRIVVPAEIPGLISVLSPAKHVPPEELDFFSVPENRTRILEREGWQCFYCLAKLDQNNHVIEHVVSRPEGDNSYKNVVAACRRCNNRKDSALAEVFGPSIARGSCPVTNLGFASRLWSDFAAVSSGPLCHETPNHQLQRTRSGGLRPPARAAELRRWASQNA